MTLQAHPVPPPAAAPPPAGPGQAATPARPADGDEKAFTARAVIVGVALSAAVAAGATYGTCYLQGSFMALGTSTVGALFLLFLLTAIANPLLHATRPSLAFGRRELLVVHIMMVMASPLASSFAAGFITFVGAPHYYATPENEWHELILPYLPDWLFLRHPAAMAGLYQGLDQGQAVQWGAWARVLAAWMPLWCGLFVVMICAMVILRRQWVEHERLIYPLTVVPLAMVEPPERGRWLGPLYRDPVLWAGFAIPAVWSTLHGLYAYWPELFVLFQNQDMLHLRVPLFRGTTELYFFFRFNILGFFYFVKTEIAFSLWFFNLLAHALRGAFGILGVSSSERILQSAIPDAIMARHSIGAMVVLFGGGAWAARRHLRAVLRKALTGDPAIDDTDEILSYRAAVILMMAGTAVVGGWLWMVGMHPGMILGLLLLSAALLVGFARIVAESGLSDASLPVIPAGALAATVGAPALGPGGLIALTTTYVWSAGIRSFVMTSAANSLKLAEHLGPRRRPLFWIMVAALTVAFLSAVGMALELSHTHGALNLHTWSKASAFDDMARLVQSPGAGDLWGWAHLGLGAAVMAALMVVRWHFLWWPLHPLGYPIGPIWIMDHLWFNMFLAWAIKVAVLRYGGVRLYRRTRPFFCGLILGQIVPGGAFLIVDHFTGMAGNIIFWG